MFQSEKSDSEVCEYNCSCVYFNLSFPSIQFPEFKAGGPEADITNPNLDVYKDLEVQNYYCVHSFVIFIGCAKYWACSNECTSIILT